jgi:hypothetical protein
LKLAELGKGAHVFPGPVWNGAAPAGKTLLIYAEQGLGDALQFARYLTLLAEAGARCVVHCGEALRPLLATVPGVTNVVSGGDALPPYDAQMALMSLPRVFETTLETIPAHVPYIVAAPEHRAAARTLMHARDGLKVGLAWAGSREHANDRNRSCPLAAFNPLLDLPDIAWFSLQHGDASAQIAAVPGGQRLMPLPAGASLTDTAALIAELDLVITVDTSIAHLAGALGQPAWVLLPFAPDWRWLLDREDSPWYPTLRLFRQSQPRDWMTVVTRLGDALQVLEGARHARI